MAGPRRWRAIEKQFLQDCAVFSVSRLVSESASGERHPFFQIDSADWVNVVPLTPGGDVVMVRQYRHGADDVTLEIPGGMIDPGESPADAAARELLEETGYRAREVAPLGSVNPNPALFTNRVYTFVARDSERVAEVSNEGTEETVVEVVPRARLRELARTGCVDHALVMAGLYFLDLEDSRSDDPG